MFYNKYAIFAVYAKLLYMSYFYINHDFVTQSNKKSNVNNHASWKIHHMMGAFYSNKIDITTLTETSEKKVWLHVSFQIKNTAIIYA